MTNSSAGALGNQFNLILIRAGKRGTGNLDIARETCDIGAGDISSRNAEVLTTLDGGVDEAACIHDDIALVAGDGGAGDGGICATHFDTVELIGIGAGDGATCNGTGHSHLAGEVGEIGIRNRAADGEVGTTLHSSIDGVALGIGAAAQGAINRDSAGHAGDIGAGNSRIHAYGHICCSGDGAVCHGGAACHGYIALVVGDGGAGDGGRSAAHFHAVDLIVIGAGNGAASNGTVDSHLAGHIGKCGVGNILTLSHGNGVCTLHGGISHGDFAVASQVEGAAAGDIKRGAANFHHLVCTGLDIHIATNRGSHTADDGLIIAIDTGIAADYIQITTHGDTDVGVIIRLVNNRGVISKIQAATGVDDSAIGNIRIGKNHITCISRNGTRYLGLVKRHIAAGGGYGTFHNNGTGAIGVGGNITRSGK